MIEQSEMLYEDGLIIDASTGEIVGENAPSAPMTAEKAEAVLQSIQRHAVTVTTCAAKLKRLTDAYNMVLVRLRQEDPEFAAVIAQMENCLDIQSRATKRRDAYLAWWSPQLKEFARSVLRGKERTWRSIFGNLKLTKVGGTFEIKDMALACVLAEKLGRGSAIQKTITKTAIKDIVVDTYFGLPSAAPAIDPLDRAIEDARIKAFAECEGAIELVPIDDKLTVEVS